MKPKLGSEIIRRIGYGAMRLPGIGKTPEDTQLACRVLQEAVDLGANVIDTAHFYGNGLANKLIADTLRPFPQKLIILTKVGVQSGPDGRPQPAATPEEIQQTVQNNLDSLGVSQLNLVFLRLPGGPLADSGVPMHESLECLAQLQEAGIIRHIGLSSASVEQITSAQAIVSVEAVQNALFVGHYESRGVVQLCHEERIPFFAYFPLGMGMLIEKKVDLSPFAEAHGATKAQIALAWLLALSPMVVPIPGTSGIDHLRENFAALDIELSSSEVEVLSKI
ncbi:MAG: aldo/keto reductase [Gammaproteobacteria bacterium]|nr:aldo/keto reductase [Gammaproteobacteria bacterium]